MIESALRQRLRELELRSLALVDSQLMGEWASNVRGQGLEFRDLREYVVGDDVRHLDWKATARSGKPQLRRFNEDRQQTIWLAIDLSASMAGAKKELAEQLLAILGWVAVKQGDRFAVAGFSDKVEVHREPQRGEAQLWATLEDILSFTPTSKRTNLKPLWEFFLRKLSHRATIILLSDFESEDDGKLLRGLALRHEVLALHLCDEREYGGIEGGLSPIEDSETGDVAWVDLSSRSFRKKATALAAEAAQQKKLRLQQASVWYGQFFTGRDFLPPLLDFFRRREEALRA